MTMTPKTEAPPTRVFASTVRSACRSILTALTAVAVVAVLHRAGPQLNKAGQELDAETETEVLLRIYAKCIAGQDEAAKRPGGDGA
ncbi:hypothetical protein [Streptosporangium sp. NPDC020145]|uniref:hypothetical protein n=1 Tax=Streptosporangium sp. NPDC020145 TaxID=3154694 RepID=UPI00342094E1